MTAAARHHPDRQGGLILLLVLTIFSTEVVLEGLCAPLFAVAGAFPWKILDPLLLSGLLALPLWFFFVRPLYRFPGGAPAVPAAQLLLQCLAILFTAELMIMLLLPSVLPTMSERGRHLVDALCTTVLSAPLLCRLIFRKGVQPTGRTDRLLEAPLRLYIVLLLMVFLLTMLQELLCAFFLPSLTREWNQLVDSMLVTLLFAPVLFFLMVRPLARSAVSEQARASALCVQMIDAVMTIDAEGEIRSVNPAAETIFGYGAAELIGENADVLFKGGRKCLKSLMVQAAPEEGRAVSHVFLASCRDGAVLTMDISISRVKIKESEEYLLMMRDVTERHRMQRELGESEERLRHIFHHSDDAIFLFDNETCAIVDLNGTAETLFGRSREELVAAGVAGLVGAQDLPLVSALIRGCNGGSRLDCVSHRRSDGSDLFLSVRGKLLTLRGVELAYCTFRDITVRVRLEEEAREMQSRLIQMNKMASLGLVVSGVAHEVNNPNNYILASAQILERAWDDALKILRAYREENGDFLIAGLPFEAMEPQIPQLCSGVMDGSRRIGEIINNLKNFARRDGDVGGVVDVNQVVRGAVAVLQYELAKHTDHFRLELGEGVPPVQGNGQQLGQVVMNLLMNACQALPARAAGIVLKTAFHEGSGEIVITLHDEGCGISADESRRVMEPFFTTKLDRGGTGLGLSICRSIVKEHRGVLEFESQPGEGTTFRVRLPAAA